ncbi:MAG: YjjG family noncanonical pyrimidine nucleotidase [Mangrovibacterium sp.]
MLNPQSKYKHLFFDLDHTLWDFKTNSACAMQQSLEELRLLEQLPSFDVFFDFYEQVNDRLWEEYRQGTTSRAELSERRFSEPFEQFHLHGVSAQQANDVYLEFMAQQKILVSGTTELLHELQAQKYQLHIISNGFVEVQERKLQSAGIASFFQSITLSEHVGAPKPKSAIFEYALKNVNARKSESLMIGDDWRNDVLGAINFGIDAVLFQESKPTYLEIKEQVSMSTFSCLNLKQAQKRKCYAVSQLLDIRDILKQ